MTKYILFFLFHFHLWAHDFAYFIQNDTICNITQTEESKIILPERFVISPDIYSFENFNYGMKKEGIYRIGNIGKSHIQRIVFDGNIDHFINSLTWVHSHGYLDDICLYENALSNVVKRRLHMSCGSVINFSQRLCEQIGIPSRFILFLTLEPWNSYSNGHSLLEVFNNGKWKLWDIDQRNFFKRNENDLNAFEFLQAVKEDVFEIIQFSTSPCLALGDLKLNGYDFSLWSEASFLFQDPLKKFYQRVCQVLLIRENGQFFFTCKTDVERKRIESYDHSFIYMSQYDFINHFYE